MLQKPMLHIIFAETALETVPIQLWNHPSVVKRAKLLHKKPQDMLLDRSYHHHAMFRLPKAAKRGRPDIIHFSLLQALGSPLNKARLVKLFIHTIDDFVISVDSRVRLPRNYDRFVGLIEQLFKEKQVPVTSSPLLELRSGTLTTILSTIQTPYIVSLTRIGKKKSLNRIIKNISQKINPVIIIGAFPRGHFSDKIVELADISVAIDPEMLETAIITSRVIYEYEKHIGLSELRWKLVS
jgi:rRNA small subunit pseudouridine methyltransferase Nep1